LIKHWLPESLLLPEIVIVVLCCAEEGEQESGAEEGACPVEGIRQAGRSASKGTPPCAHLRGFFRMPCTLKRTFISKMVC
jgi:hypothetical protein